MLSLRKKVESMDSSTKWILVVDDDSDIIMKGVNGISGCGQPKISWSAWEPQFIRKTAPTPQH